MDRKQEMDALHAAAAAAYEVLREHGMEHFVSVLVVDRHREHAGLHVRRRTSGRAWTALVNGEIVLEGPAGASA
jgi:hypothetical protein